MNFIDRILNFDYILRFVMQNMRYYYNVFEFILDVCVCVVCVCVCVCVCVNMYNKCIHVSI